MDTYVPILDHKLRKKQKNNIYSIKYESSDLYISTVDTVIKKIQTNYGSRKLHRF